MKRRTLVYFLCFSILGARGSAAPPATLSAEDLAAIRKVHRQYEQTWLQGDADGVRALFTDDCVLFPPHADTPRLGKKGMNEFPPHAPTTTITKLVVHIKDIGGDSQTAYVWGSHEVAWTTTQGGHRSSRSHTGYFLNVLRKQPNGEWKISHHMWDDAIPQS